MQKINKELSLALSYKKWLEGLNKALITHPEYKSTHRFYKDVVGNLLWVQKGLCAYTEMYLMNPETVAPKNWEKGSIKNFDFLGHLDHYNATLKPKKGWEWDNFFVVHSDVNVKVKGAKKVNNLLKPDKKKFNPFLYLEYDFKTHHFIPNRELSIVVQKRVLSDLNTLGLNYKPIIDYRKEYLKPIIDDVILKKETLKTAKTKLIKFYTAFEMSIASLGIG